MDTKGLSATAVAVLEAITNRRSIGRLTSECPDQHLVERVIQTTLFAPNHRHTQPWRFLVLAGDARIRGGEVLERSLVRRLEDPEAPSSLEARRSERAKFLRAPVIIIVAVEPSNEPNVSLDEEIAAGAAGVQNLLLASHAVGLAAVWRTGDSVRDEVVPTEFGFAQSSVIIGYVYLGYPDPGHVVKPRPNRLPSKNTTRWEGWK
ncbi:MAG: nitroreductase [Chloroflexi bacterium]|nr:nitroreductase [Chloroflexota bacterium]